jgi:Rrf2 family iron-sulfur cluster assembly transcriptional regulator
MKLSTRSRYGTRLMLDLARSYDRRATPLAQIAKSQNLSVKYLEQLIIPLKASGLIRSVRGARGGYRLAQSPGRITVGQIVEVLEGGLSLVECVENPKVCKLQADCLTRPVWQGVSRLLKDHLSSLTLQDVLEGKKLPA